MHSLDLLDSVLQVLDDLDRNSADDANNSERRHERTAYRKAVTMLVPASKDTQKSEFNLQIKDRPVVIKTWSRNISRGGFGFIYLAQIVKPQLYFCLESPEWGRALFGAEIIRSRAIQDGFWEYGVKFRSRLMLPRTAQPKTQIRPDGNPTDSQSLIPNQPETVGHWSQPQDSPLYLPNPSDESRNDGDSVDSMEALLIAS